MSVIHLTEETFEQAVASGTVLVDFWAEWCGPCKIIGPVLDQLATEVPEGAKVCKVDVENQRELAKKFRVMSIPTLILFKDGEKVKTLVGVQSKEDLLELFK